MDSQKIHNYYLIGKDNFDAGLNSATKNIQDNLTSDILKFNPPKFKFRNTIHEVGFNVKIEYENYKYSPENETIVVFEVFHFKDFDAGELNLWSYFELLFHQGYLYGVSFKSSKISIYEKFKQYLTQIYGQYKEIPPQGSSSKTVAWFSDKSNNSIFLEIDHQSNGDEFLVLTYYDDFLHMALNKPINVYPLIRNQLYELDKQVKPNSFFQKTKNILSLSKKRNDLSFEECKHFVDGIISDDITLKKLKTVSEFIIKNVKVEKINLQWYDWLMKMAVMVQNGHLLTEAESIYSLVLGGYNNPNTIKTNEKILLVSCAYKNLINVCCDSSKYEEAILNFKQSIRVLENHFSVNDYNFQSIVGESHYNIAIVYYELEDYLLSIEHYQKALKHLENLVTPWMNNKDKETILLSFNNLGNTYTKIENYDEAGSTFATAIRFANDHENYFHYAMLVMNLAYMWVNNKKYTEAEKQYKHVLDFVKGNPRLFHSSDLQGKILINMADFYKEIQIPKKEKKYLSEALAFYTDALGKQPHMNQLVGNLKIRLDELQKNQS